ncbi:hypothetical protein W01_25250 [Candidatus Nitrotoga sp. AM1P]|nr:hypothetical protein W01_25250 [Candidatus Nitrotoga sp. AM1P]
MYLDSEDYQTVWQLAHNWVGANPEISDPDLFSDELKHSIHRLMSAAINQAEREGLNFSWMILFSRWCPIFAIS